MFSAICANRRVLRSLRNNRLAACSRLKRLLNLQKKKRRRKGYQKYLVKREGPFFTTVYVVWCVERVLGINKCTLLGWAERMGWWEGQGMQFYSFDWLKLTSKRMRGYPELPLAPAFRHAHFRYSSFPATRTFAI